MTSMPASRSARAMIFAPRSCPSRPGLATTTRIFLVEEAAAMRPILWLARHPELHRHVRLVDRADDRVRAGARDPLAVGPRALERGAELRRALGHGEIVQVLAGPAPRDLGALLDRDRRDGSLADEVVVADLDRARRGERGQGEHGRRDGDYGYDEQLAHGVREPFRDG